MAIVDEGAKHALILGGDSYQTFIDTMSQWLQRLSENEASVWVL